MSSPIHWMALPGDTGPTFPFLTLRGALTPSRQMFDREVRVGVNGIGIWYTGQRGEPFGIQTEIDSPTLLQANQGYAAYRSRIGKRMDLYFNNTFWGPVLIHNVTLNDIAKTKTAVGGIAVGSASQAFLVRCSWQIESLYD